MRKRQFSCSVRFKLRPADGDAALMYWFPQQTTVARSISRMCRISADGKLAVRLVLIVFMKYIYI